MPGKYQPYKCLKPVPFVVCTGITTRNGPTVFRYCVPLSRNYYKLLSQAIVFGIAPPTRKFGRGLVYIYTYRNRNLMKGYFKMKQKNE